MTSFSYNISTEVPSSYVKTLLDFIYVQYLFPQAKKYSQFSQKQVEGVPVLSYVVLDNNLRSALEVEIKGNIPLELTLRPLIEGLSSKLIELTKQDVVIAIQVFEEKSRKRTLYFAWREGEKIIPETLRKEEKSLKRLLFETQLLFFLLITTLTMFLFYFISFNRPDLLWVAPLIIILVPFVIVFFSSNIISRNADWTITQKNPYIHILTYHLPLDYFKNFNQIPNKQQKLQIKKEIFAEILSKKGEIDCISASKILQKHNISCAPENLLSKKINVYDLVKQTAVRFGFPLPKIMVSNTMAPNAATSGPSPSRGLVLITTGLLVQLEKEEIISVLGHEFGHLKGRDPLLLYFITSGEFLFRYYILLPLFPFLFSPFLFIAYFWITMVIIFFIGKFFEARADLTSAQEIGNPSALAAALEKIGFKKLLYERASSFRIQEWLGLDPHPPIYFRINRLRKLDTSKKVKHLLTQSIKDVFKGFIETL